MTLPKSGFLTVRFRMMTILNDDKTWVALNVPLSAHLRFATTLQMNSCSCTRECLLSCFDSTKVFNCVANIAC